MNKNALSDIKECNCKAYLSGNFCEGLNHLASNKMNDKELFHVEFENLDKLIKSSRTIYFSYSCKECGGKIIKGCSFTDCRVTDEGVILNSIIKASQELDIPIYNSIVKVEEIFKGYHKDKHGDFFEKLKETYKVKPDEKSMKIKFKDKNYLLVDIRAEQRFLLRDDTANIFANWEDGEIV